MAISYIELTRLAVHGEVVVVEENGALLFDVIVSTGGTQISYDKLTGAITFHEAGYYYIDWYVAPQFGLTTNGSNWAIRTGPGPGQQSLIGSSHTKVSATTGFAILNVAADETAQLVNVSDGALYLSEAVDAKAGLIAYGIQQS